MNAKQLLKMAFVTVLFVALASCKKDDTMLLSTTNNHETEIITPVENAGLKGIDPSQTFAGLESIHGMNYDFSSYVRANAVTADNSTVYLWVVPSLWFDTMWLSVIINNSAQIIGLYELEYTSYFISSKDEEGEEFVASYYINDIDVPIYSMFRGSIAANNYGISDVLSVSSTGLAVPTDYPYPVFANVAAGTYNLGTCNTSYNNNPSPIPLDALTALRVATTFYNNFFE